MSVCGGEERGSYCKRILQNTEEYGAWMNAYKQHVSKRFHEHFTVQNHVIFVPSLQSK